MSEEELADQVTEVENLGMVVDALKEELTDQAVQVQGLRSTTDGSKDHVEQYKAEGKQLPTVSGKGPEGAGRQAQSSQDAKSLADARLRQEMAQLDKKEKE